LHPALPAASLENVAANNCFSGILFTRRRFGEKLQIQQFSFLCGLFRPLDSLSYAYLQSLAHHRLTLLRSWARPRTSIAEALWGLNRLKKLSLERFEHRHDAVPFMIPPAGW